VTTEQEYQHEDTYGDLERSEAGVREHGETLETKIKKDVKRETTRVNTNGRMKSRKFNSSTKISGLRIDANERGTRDNMNDRKMKWKHLGIANVTGNNTKNPIRFKLRSSQSDNSDSTREEKTIAHESSAAQI
jgi:hypothetical protein